MSFKKREKQRRRKLAISNGQVRQRKHHANRHYITIVSRSACCNVCGGSLRRGRPCVYRYEPREILCVECADRRKVSYRPSRRWDKVQPKQKAA